MAIVGSAFIRAQTEGRLQGCLAEWENAFKAESGKLKAESGFASFQISTYFQLSAYFQR
jgi:hypothetical protein